MPRHSRSDQNHIKEELDRLLDEIRIVLPGTGILLGFQFNAIFAQGFGKLSHFFQILHVISLLLLLLTVIFLIAPVAFDRVVEGSKEIKPFYGFAHRMVTVALILLALGLSLDVVIVLHLIINDIAAWIIAGILFAICIFLWFGYTYYRREQRD